MALPLNIIEDAFIFLAGAWVGRWSKTSTTTSTPAPAASVKATAAIKPVPTATTNAVCSVCGLTVARWSLVNGKPVCANDKPTEAA